VAALFSGMDGYLALETKKDFFKRMLNVLLSTAASSSVVHVNLRELAYLVMLKCLTRSRLSGLIDHLGKVKGFCLKERIRL